MENDLFAILGDVAGGAAGTVAVIAFAWRTLTEIRQEVKTVRRELTIVLTKLGVHDNESSE